MHLKLAGLAAGSTLVAMLLLGETYGQDITSAEDLIEQLAVKPDPKVLTRSITVNVANADQGRASFNTIQFEHNSDKLTQESTGQLVELGKALSNDRLVNESFVIEGHADAYGDAQYNKDLSLRRAITVKKFLAAQVGIAEHRLQVFGKGEEEPQTDDPYDPENRRVDVVNLKVYE